MERLKHHEELQALQNLRKHYEKQLQTIGLQLTDLPDEVNTLLDECVKLQNVINVAELKESYLKEFYFNKKKEQIENSAVKAKLQLEIKEQEAQIEKENAEITLLEKFIESVEIVSETEMAQNKLELESMIQGLHDRQKKLNIPEDFYIDELIKKVDKLNSPEATEK